MPLGSYFIRKDTRARCCPTPTTATSSRSTRFMRSANGARGVGRLPQGVQRVGASARRDPAAESKPVRQEAARRRRVRRSLDEAGRLAADRRSEPADGERVLRRAAAVTVGVRPRVAPSASCMPPECLTVLAPIKQGEVAALRARASSDRRRHQRHAHAAWRAAAHRVHRRAVAIHFARFAILTDPDRGPDRARLLYASVYRRHPGGARGRAGGPVVGLRRDLGTSCEGYTGRGRLRRVPEGTRARAGRLLHRLSRRDGRVDPARDCRTGRDETRADAGDRSRHGAGSRLLDRFVSGDRTGRSARRPSWRTSSSRWRGTGSSTSIAGTLRILARSDRYPVFRLVNRLTRNRLPPRRSPYSSVADGRVRGTGAARAGRRDPVRSSAWLSRGRGHPEPADARHGDRRRPRRIACAR